MSKALIKSSIQKQKLHVKYLIQKTTESKKFDKDYKNLKAKKKKKTSLKINRNVQGIPSDHEK